MKAEIIVKNLCKSFGKTKILDNISFEVKKGEFVSIIGPSGCGKTTLLYLVEGFIENTKGIIKTDGKKGFIFQDHNLFPWKTVKGNIEIRNKRINILKEINLGEFKDHYPHQISEGMKQRVGIARALANNPQILLMDEPFSSLDYLTRLKMQDFIIKLFKKRKLTVILITHDIDEAIKLSDRIVVLSKRPSTILDIIQVKKNTGRIKKKVLELITA